MLALREGARRGKETNVSRPTGPTDRPRTSRANSALFSLGFIFHLSNINLVSLSFSLSLYCLFSSSLLNIRSEWDSDSPLSLSLSLTLSTNLCRASNWKRIDCASSSSYRRRRSSSLPRSSRSTGLPEQDLHYAKNPDDEDCYIFGKSLINVYDYGYIHSHRLDQCYLCRKKCILSSK